MSKVNFNWSDTKENTFNSVKQALSSAPVLKFADPTKQFIIESDASNFAIGAVLLQEFDGIEHPIAYFSCKMLPAEVNYPIYDKELLAIVECFRLWRHYLKGSKYTIQVFIDHNNLQYFTTTKQLSRRQARWSERLASFD